LNKLTKLLITATLTMSLFVFPSLAGAASYTVQPGDTFKTIGEKHGVTETNLQIANQRSGANLIAGESIEIPDSLTYAEKELLANLVHAEAQGEPYAGKVAVATVVLNRVDADEFPNTVRGVIYEKVAGHYAFSPVLDGTINEGYTEEEMKAVNEAMAFRGQGNGSLYFYNPQTATSDWVFSRDTILTIGNHRFAK
jgi:N-acetylmuramoyl-L-alanine amidase